MARPAIVETVLSQLVAEGRELLADLAASEKAAAARRIVVGRFLLKARAQLPKRGSREEGWTAFLESIEVDGETARRYMALADATQNLSLSDSDQAPTYEELGLTKREGARNDEAPHAVTGDPPAVDVDVSDLGGEPEVEIDRDTWCTPRWATEALGPVDLDPCANERSHVQAARTFDLDRRGEDGLALASGVPADALVFINPPYSDVPPWVEAYAHVRFCFLLKFDPSTKWFAALIARTALVLIPKRTRIEFEAPPGVPREKSLANQFPHAFFFARAEDAPKALLDRCYAWRVETAA